MEILQKDNPEIAIGFKTLDDIYMTRIGEPPEGDCPSKLVRNWEAKADEFYKELKIRKRELARRSYDTAKA